MSRDITRRTLRLGYLFFLYGALVHFGILEVYKGRAYPAGSDRSFVGHPLTLGTFLLLGGAWTAFCMGRLHRKTLDTANIPFLRLLFRGGLYGILASTLAWESLYVLTALYMSLPSPFFVLWFIGIQTYGMEAIIISIPFAFAYGGLVGAFLFFGAGHNREESSPAR